MSVVGKMLVESAKAALGAGLLIAPLMAFFAAAVFIDATGSTPYFEAVSQIIPLLIVALVIEGRYFSLRDQILRLFGEDRIVRFLGRLYGLVYVGLTFLFVIFAEFVALGELARESHTSIGVSLTAGGLAGGIVALVISVLLPTDTRHAKS